MYDNILHTHAHKHACSHVSTHARVCPIASSKQENSIRHAKWWIIRRIDT